MAKLHLDRLRARPLSWTSISSWTFNKEQWARKYLDNIVDPPNPAMTFGKIVGERLASDPTYLPEVPRLPIFEHGINLTFAGIPLVGFFDSFCPETPALYEYKTSGNSNRWTQQKAEGHGQIDLYVTLLYMTNKIKPEDLKIKLVYIPVIETGSFELDINSKGIKIFEIKKTMSDVLKCAGMIKRVYKEMEEYALSYQQE